jgi:hypothetical protein
MSEPTLDVDALLVTVTARRQTGRRPEYLSLATLSELFLHAGVRNVSDDDLLTAVRTRLAEAPELIDLWQRWSYDKRWSPSPYLDGLEVGHYDAGKRDVRRHATTVDACADFVLAEVRWLVDRRVVEPS